MDTMEAIYLILAVLAVFAVIGGLMVWPPLSRSHACTDGSSTGRNSLAPELTVREGFQRNDDGCDDGRNARRDDFTPDNARGVVRLRRGFPIPDTSVAGVSVSTMLLTHDSNFTWESSIGRRSTVYLANTLSHRGPDRPRPRERFPAMGCCACGDRYQPRYLIGSIVVRTSTDVKLQFSLLS